MAIGVVVLLGQFLAWGQEKNSCVECHSGMQGDLARPAAKFADDVHQHAGFTCVDCHGGDAKADDPEQAMSKARGFVGKVPRTAIPGLCARCHSDAATMHKYRPQQRVDQLAQYLTSVHGKRLSAGDQSVATCIDCHSVHDIREVKNPLSPVYPLQLPATCAKCHADAQYMAGYKIPTNQYADYQESVHWEALSKERDLAAPNCASCHGNHGATPPQVASVAAVCGTCHALMQDLYQKSPHQPVFEAMGTPGCVVCHSNHAITQPSPAMLAGDGSVCSQCHDADSAGGKVAEQMHTRILALSDSLDRSRRILEEARVAGMEVSDSQLKLQDAQAMLVKARVAVHAFRGEAVEEQVKEGLAVSGECFTAGEAAMHERDLRRQGLAVSLAAIFLTVAGLWFKIRSLERGETALGQQGR